MALATTYKKCKAMDSVEMVVHCKYLVEIRTILHYHQHSNTHITTIVVYY